MWRLRWQTLCRYAVGSAAQWAFHPGREGSLAAAPGSAASESSCHSKRVGGQGGCVRDDLIAYADNVRIARLLRCLGSVNVVACINEATTAGLRAECPTCLTCAPQSEQRNRGVQAPGPCSCGSAPSGAPENIPAGIASPRSGGYYRALKSGHTEVTRTVRGSLRPLGALGLEACAKPRECVLVSISPPAGLYPLVRADPNVEQARNIGFPCDARAAAGRRQRR